MFSGVMVAIVTPFKNGAFDEQAFRDLIRFQIEGGVDAIVPCGTTGESATMDHAEHKRVTEVAIDEAGGKIKVIAGTGSNSTQEAIQLTVHAKEAGADGALMVSPYYNKPTQEGIYQHFKAVAEAADIPIILYNIPGRTASNMAPETIARLAKINNIVGVKEATGDLNQMAKTIEVCGPDFDVVSGDDGLTLPLLSIGGKGVISVVANMMPRRMSEMMAAWNAGDLGKTREIFFELLPLMRAMFLETNPIPIKTALHLMGKMDLDFRLPLCPMAEANQAKLVEVMKGYGLID